MNTVPTRLVPALGDGHDANTLVTKAWMALSMFGGAESLDTVKAAALLVMWKHYRQLTAAEVAAVVRRFPRPSTPTLPPGVLGQPVGIRTRSIGGRS